MYFITTKRMLEVCFSAHPNIQYRTFVSKKTLYMSTANRPDGHRAWPPFSFYDFVKS